MTDLERARGRGKLAEQCGKTLAAAAEMRERAAQFIEEKQRAQRIWLPFGDEIRALSLTPDEPT